MHKIQSASKPPQNIAFIANISRLVDTETFTFMPGYELRRATKSEIGILSETLRSYFPRDEMINRDLWRYRLKERITESLPEKEWRYFVIGFSNSNSEIIELQYASDIAPLELEIIFTIIYPTASGRINVYIPDRLFQVLNPAPRNPSFFRTVTNADLEFIKDNYNRIKRHDDKLLNIRRILEQFDSLKAIRKGSELRFLGYIAIIESLLTHNPEPGDPYASITRQIKRKLALLNNRWAPKIDYNTFEKSTPESIWTAMYKYRSIIAHGGSPDFNNNELRLLKSADHARDLARDTAKAITRQALIEPHFIKDLRDC